jgi:hypothetical protein
VHNGVSGLVGDIELFPPSLVSNCSGFQETSVLPVNRRYSTFP